MVSRSLSSLELWDSNQVLSSGLRGFTIGTAFRSKLNPSGKYSFRFHQQVITFITVGPPRRIPSLIEEILLKIFHRKEWTNQCLMGISSLSNQ